MHATVGDRLHVHSRTVGLDDTIGEILEVRGTEGAPPYLVRFPDGHEGLVYPGPDSLVEPRTSSESPSRTKDSSSTR
ncbi:DUF1918 domain-containing protein [Saccharothrix deserti]|uniref:DUF1918 domain-containing protein n=1 Tax=Saccharothrix deserti TaxID=2593674 RepID=UPI00131D41A1|nr:DUF1918 domain-containing protein [Saccharothrix deserti]